MSSVVDRSARRDYRRLGGFNPRVLARAAHRANRRAVRAAIQAARDFSDFDIPSPPPAVTGWEVI